MSLYVLLTCNKFNILPPELGHAAIAQDVVALIAHLEYALIHVFCPFSKLILHPWCRSPQLLPEQQTVFGGGIVMHFSSYFPEKEKVKVSI
mgnify:CR=1 FL=1